MRHCHRGHLRVADRQRRCVECRRGYDRARIGTAERRASQRRYEATPLGRLNANLYRGRRGMAQKRSKIANLEAQLV